MTARPGDYRLIDVDSGAQWSITPESLATGYVPLGDHNYESHGHVTAHQLAHDAQPEQVTSAEGEETAVAGDWIVTDDRGNSWVVSDDYFEANYRPVDDDIAR